MLVIVGSITGSAATAEAKKSPGRVERTVEPVRSGSILTGTGWVFDNALGGCQVSPECAAWLQNDCSPTLVGIDPGVTASIADVAGLADGRTERIFEFGSGDPRGPVWGGAQVQFWDYNCTEIRAMRWRSTDCDGDATGRDCVKKRFRIPVSARWMTVTGYQDNVNLTWTLI